MARPPTAHPTDLELEVLQALWRRGPSSVGEIRDALAARRPLAYTSVMTVMNIMTRKGYLARRKNGRAYLYRPRKSEGRTLGGIFQDLVKRAFGGSPRAALIHLLETSNLEVEELDELRRLIDRKTREGPP